MFRRLIIIALVLVCAASWLFTLHVARRAFHMTPDAVDYLTISRQRALGRGWTMPIKWCWADDAPAVHSALGERPIAWPALARYAVLIDPENPGPPAQVLNTLLIGLAAVAWGFVAAQIAGTAIAGWLMAALLLTSATTLFVTTAALTEPLYLLELGLLALLIGPKSHEKISPAMQGGLLGLLTAALYLTRPTGPIVVLALLLHFLLSRGAGWRKRFGVWALIAVPLLALWHFAVWRAWGDPFHNLTSVHLHVLNITEVMFGGWGSDLPSVGTLFATRGGEIIAKWGEHLLLHTEALIEPGALGLLAPLLALVAVQAMSRWRPWALLWLLALGHWLGAVLTWATTEPARLTLPTVICLLPLCLAAATDLLRHHPPAEAEEEREKGTACRAPTQRRDEGGEGGATGFRLAAILICTATLAFAAMGMLMKSRQLAQTGWPVDLPNPPIPADFSPHRVVCTDSPFRLAYRSDVACVIYPFDLPGRDPSLWPEFIEQFDVRFFAVQTQGRVDELMPLLAAGRLRLLDAPDPEFAWLEVLDE